MRGVMRRRRSVCALALGAVVGAGAAGCLGSPAPSQAAATSSLRPRRETPRPDASASARTSATATATANTDAERPKDAGTAVTTDHDGGAAADEPVTPAKDVAPPRHHARVLHVGDSTVGGYGGLAKALKTRFTAEDTLYTSDTIVSLGIRAFARTRTLRADLARVKPDLVLLTLGANDVFLPSPEKLAGDVRAIVATVGTRDCYWIGPPTWKTDTGIVAVIRANVGHCRFFDSSLLPLARAKDGIHPTDRGGEQWADRIWPMLHRPEDASNN